MKKFIIAIAFVLVGSFVVANSAKEVKTVTFDEATEIACELAEAELIRDQH